MKTKNFKTHINIIFYGKDLIRLNYKLLINLIFELISIFVIINLS